MSTGQGKGGCRVRVCLTVRSKPKFIGEGVAASSVPGWSLHGRWTQPHTVAPSLGTENERAGWGRCKDFHTKTFRVISASCHRFAGCWALSFDWIFLACIEEKGALSTPGAADEDAQQTQRQPAWFNCNFVSL